MPTEIKSECIIFNGIAFRRYPVLYTGLIGIITHLMPQRAGEALGPCIKRYGNPIMETSRLDTLSTTKTAIRLTTQSRILFALMLHGMVNITDIVRREWLGYVNTLLRYDRLVPVGISPIKGPRLALSEHGKEVFC